MKSIRPSAPLLPAAVQNLVKKLKFNAALAAVVVVAGCGDNQDPEGAKDLYARLQEAGYRSWQRAPGYESRKKSNAVHADFVDIYVNDVTARALASNGRVSEWPEGSVIAKDGFDQAGKLEVVAVMEKRSDGWYWAEYFGGNTEAKYAGRPAVCTDCHRRSKDDFVLAFPLPNRDPSQLNRRLHGGEATPPCRAGDGRGAWRAFGRR